ncbi:MAG: sigma-70 family RNA polymerase sigma factor [Anaerolineae bacterium]|nr:sigma-70 family RNA polymerase sigma factor [Anaerolineae bacterium]
MDYSTVVSLSEQALVDRALAQPAAFADIYDQYALRVYTYIRCRVNDVPTADDLTAQTFEQALLSLGNYRAEQAPLGAWLFGIAHHVVSNHYRAQRRRQWLPLDTIMSYESDIPPLEDIAIRNETNHRLVQAVARLRDHERDLIALKFVAGLTNRQIAEMTSFSESNVGVTLYRSLKQLRGILSDE